MKEMTPRYIETLFERTNFGGAEKADIGRRGLLVECVLKRAAGYHAGGTITSICKDAGLLTKGGNPRKAGIKWAFHQLYKSSSPTILERLQSANPEGGKRCTNCGTIVSQYNLPLQLDAARSTTKCQQCETQEPS